MVWITSHEDLADHPKTKRLRRLLSLDEYQSIGVLHKLWWWATRYADDGDLASYSDEDIADAVNWPGQPGALSASLREAGFIDPDGKIHNWHRYAGRLIERRRSDAERKRRSEDARGTSGHTHSNSAGDPPEIRRRSAGVRADSGVTVTVEKPLQHTGNPPLADPIANGSASAPPPQDSGVHESPNPGDSLEPIDFQAPTPIRAKRPPSNKYAEVIELVNSAGVPLPTGPRDGKAVKSCSAPPGDIAAAYVARARGEWVPYRLRDSFSLHSVIDELAGWLSRDVPTQPPNRRRALLPGDSNRFDQYEEARKIHVAEMDERQRQVAADMAAQQKGYA